MSEGAYEKTSYSIPGLQLDELVHMRNHSIHAQAHDAINVAKVELTWYRSCAIYSSKTSESDQTHCAADMHQNPLPTLKDS